MKSARILTLSWVAALLAAALPGMAQDDAAPPEQPRFRTEATAVKVPVVVINDQDQLVTTLTQDRFTILEDGVEQDIISFQGGKAEPLTLVIMLEYGRTAAYLRRQALRPAAIFASQILGPDDYAALISFDRKPEILSDFTRNRQMLLDGVNRLVRSPPFFDDSSLYDAVVFALQGGVLDDQEYKGLSEVQGRTGLLLVATGINSFSNASFDDALRAAANSGVPIYSIGIGEMLFVRAERYMSGSQRMDFLRAKATLNEFSKVSGGRAYHIRFQGALDNVLESAAAMLRLQYTLAYIPKNPLVAGSDEKRTIEVLVDLDGDGDPDQDGVEIQHRREYRAAKK